MKSTKLLTLVTFPLVLGGLLLYGAEIAGGLASAAGAFEESATLIASDGANNDSFGNSAVISGDTAVVGSYDDDTVAGAGAGSVYVFVRSGSIWTQVQNLTASDGAAGDNFGYSVAMSGNTLVVGAERDDTARGSAYVFTRIAGVWTEQQKLTASDRSGFDLFGHSVAISGETIIAGAFGSNVPGNDDAGAAYIYTRSAGIWTQQQKLAAADAGMQDNFGFSVGINADTVVVGAYQDDLTAGNDAGSAYVFTRTGTVWTQQQKLTASDAAEGDFFGNSVAISGNTIVVGAFFDDTPRGDSSGSAYVYVRSGTVWAEQQHLTASDGASIDDFGYSVAISGNTIVVGAVGGNTTSGANSGTAYVYTRNGTIWAEQQELSASASASNEDFFGSAVAISENNIIVGAFFDDTAGGENAGAASIFSSPSVSVGGKVSTPSGLGLRNAVVALIDSQGVRRTATTSSFGIYAFDSVTIGETYTITVGSKRFRFASRTLQFNANASDVDFIGLE